MSRSLDSNLLSQLKLEDPRPVYEELSSLFANLPHSGLLEIEILGQSHQLEAGVNYLQDGNAIAIPKLRLVQAFFVARRILHAYLATAVEVVPESVTAATAILLLMDPEHLTAANTRKRALSTPSNMTQDNLKKEKQFVDSLLTARLHRHTKSPTLWFHRRWVVTTCCTLGMVLNTRHDMQNVVMVAGARHPRNYVAWQHARFLVDHDPSLVAVVASDVTEFCLRNHSDISGWAFLSDCISRIQDEESRKLACTSVLHDVLSMAESFRWTNESVWVFLRTVVARECVDEHDFRCFIATNDKLTALMPHNSPQWDILERARQWCSNCRVSTSCQT
ncbi:hypothetical protein F4808DRAFT_234376 [Astrocystis sublimbata]|nr:hypothetical protein F4808DRAFT_234376 [Astrocystis sublimbata]